MIYMNGKTISPLIVAPSSTNESDVLISLSKLGLKEGFSNAKNNTEILQNLIKTYPFGEKTFLFPKGEFYFDPIDFSTIDKAISIKIKGVASEFNSPMFDYPRTTIYTSGQDFLYDRRTPSPGITFYAENISIQSRSLTEVPSGVCMGAENDSGDEYNFHFNNVRIGGFDYGFKSPGWTCGASGGNVVAISGCHYGIYLPKASHLFNLDNIELLYNRVGIRFGHGGTPCSVSNIHIATGYFGADQDNFEEYIAIHCKGAVDISNIYHEEYEPTAKGHKTIIIDYEGWSYDLSAVKVRNCAIGKPSANGGLFFRGNTFAGAGIEAGNTSPIKIKPWDKGWYPDGAVHFIDCKLPKTVNGFNECISINSIFESASTNYKKVLFGYTFNGSKHYSNDLLYGEFPVVKKCGKLSLLTPNSTSLVAQYNYDSFSKGKNNVTINNLNTIIDNGISLQAGDVEYEISATINGTISANTNVTFGIFIRKDFDHATTKLIKPILTLSNSKSYTNENIYFKDCFDKSIYTSGENQIFFGYICNGSITNNLTSNDLNIIDWNFTQRLIKSHQ